MLADRRLSRGSLIVREDARKLMFLTASDGTAVLGYAGLGATAHGTESSDWMSAVLRGRNLPLEQSLGLIADALPRQFPRHLHGAPHAIVIGAFIGNEPRMYLLGTALGLDRKNYRVCFLRLNHAAAGGRAPSRANVSGSGAAALVKDQRWLRPLLSLVQACDRKKVSPEAVADYLAKLNQVAHLQTANKSVGPRCIVAWRHSKARHDGGGGHRAYDGAKVESETPFLPTISNGMDLTAVLGVLTKHIAPVHVAMRAGDLDASWDQEAVSADLAQLSEHPDENLR